ncbi:MAG: DsbA family protein [Alteromonadaceae bacterium]|nr:DsbA family protein [Alteromonadaceae bacterium]
MNSRMLIIAGLTILLAAGAAFYLFAESPAVSEAQSPVSSTSVPAKAAETVEPSPSDIPDMAMGNAMAAVEVIEYASFTCPHCAAFHNNQFKQIKKNYIDTGKINFKFREVYFDQFGLIASMIGRCEGSDAFYFDYIEQVFAQQKEWIASRDGELIMKELAKIGTSAGLTEAQLGTCMADNAKAETLVEWYKQNAEQDGIRSTPSFVINGELHGNMPYEEFADILDAKLGL